MNSQLIGRKEEIHCLKAFLKSDSPEFMALYGRRRVGKTFLIRQYFNQNNILFFNVTGAKNAPMGEQIKHFAKQVGDTFYNSATLSIPNSWDEALQQLNKAFKTVERKKIVLFFDELPWMSTPRSRLLQNLDYYWNHYWSNDPRIKLIICGSSASWIINKILKDPGGLHNRVTKRIHLQPFNLLETQHFLNKNGIDLNKKQILLLYMVTGGIPYYLTQLEGKLTAMQLIEKLAFSKNAFLLDEYDHLFESLFTDSNIYSKLVENIAAHRYGIGQRKLLEKTNILGGFGTKKLIELEETGFIMSFKPIYHKKKGTYYKLIDKYILFYLKWIKPIRTTLQKHALSKGNWQAMQNTPAWNNWLGYAFEAICYKHLSAIRKALNICPSAIADTWRYVPRNKIKEHGAQIDLLFDRPDDAITICEIKYSEKPFVLTKAYVDVLQQKIEVFKEQTRTNKQIFLALISANGVKNNYYADNILSGIVTLDDLFV